MRSVLPVRAVESGDALFGAGVGPSFDVICASVSFV